MRRKTSDDLFVAPSNKQKALPHEFMIDALAPLGPYTRPMFGCTAVYVEDKIMMVLRDKPEPAVDNGVWLATTQEHHASLKAELPSLKSISVLGPGVTGWQIIPAGLAGFEEESMRAARMVLAGDPRIGKVPAAKRPKGTAAKQTKASKPAAKAAVKAPTAKKTAAKKTAAKKTATAKTVTKKKSAAKKPLVAKSAAKKRAK
ncbi:Integration host factor beta subunit protein [Minicystis rosea]|nr:Integration host factor beta subunit protein [Minicystis rosea]